jgi:serine/threonine protein kinase
LALEIAAQVAAALAAVHKLKLVHRDIKTSNIMVSLEEVKDRSNVQMTNARRRAGFA